MIEIDCDVSSVKVYDGQSTNGIKLYDACNDDFNSNSNFISSDPYALVLISLQDSSMLDDNGYEVLQNVTISFENDSQPKGIGCVPTTQCYGDYCIRLGSSLELNSGMLEISEDKGQN